MNVFASILVGTDGSDTATTALATRSTLAGARRQAADRQRVRARVRPAAAQRGIEAPQDLQWMINPREDVLQVLQQAERRREVRWREPRSRHSRARATPRTRSSMSPRSSASDLIVVGNRGMTGAKRFLLGSVPNKVSHHAPCSVLIVRTTSIAPVVAIGPVEPVCACEPTRSRRRR